jgi:RNA-binding protein YhbY
VKVRNFLKQMATVIAITICFSAVSYALPSLDPQHWDTLTVDERVGTKTNETVITVIQDSAKPLVWYYVPNRPRLAETVTKIDGKKLVRPVFQLMTLQTKSAKTKKIYEEGMLQFSLRMDLQPDTASQAKQLLFKKLEKDGKAESLEELRLLPLSVSSASVSIYEPSGEWLSSGVQQPAIAPIFSTQAVPFQINLTSLGADAMKALTQKGQGGLGVYYEMHFEGVLPPAKVTVEVDWDQTFSHVSKNTKKKHYWNVLLFAGGTKTSNKQEIAEDLIENKCIKVTMHGREDELEALQAVLDPIMERINNELVAKMSPPEKVDPAQADNPKSGIGMFYGGGSSFAMKDKKVTKKGKETITFDRAKIITRATSCGTFVGIGNYDKKVIEEANIVMEPGNWEKAYYTIPAVGNDPKLLSINLNQYVQYKGEEGKLPKFSGCENPQLITWKPGAVDGNPGWVDKHGNPVSNISWPLQALYAEARAKNKDINDYVEYRVEVKITSQGKGALVDEVNLSKIIPMMAGDKPVTNPMALVDTLTVSCDYLTFAEDIRNDYGLIKAMYEIKRKSADGKKTIDTYRWNFTAKDYADYKTTHSWYIPKEGAFQYIPKVTFMPSKPVGVRKAEWEYNGKDLLADDGWGYLYVDPGDEAWDPEW